MVIYLNDILRTFGKYLLIPGLTTRECTPANVSLKTPLVKFKSGEKSVTELNIPFASAIIQSASGPKLTTELARNGGLSFIFGSQPIESQADMVCKIKKSKAGFVISDPNLTPENTLADVLELVRRTEYSTIGVTDDGTPNGRLLGMATSRDYREGKDPIDMKVKDFMTSSAKLIAGELGITLKEANQTIWGHKLNTLSIIDKGQKLQYFVSRKDYDSHHENPKELSGGDKKLLVGAGIDTCDYKERVPALAEAGVDVLCIDSSDGHSEWQYKTLHWIEDIHGDKVLVGAGNMVDQDGLNCLTDVGADFIKVDIGGGPVCITREQKGIGCGQVVVLIDVAKARDEYLERHDVYILVCSDGDLVHDYRMVLALAMGADFLMMGRYFARSDESPTKKMKIGNNFVKEHQGEESNHAKNWQRYGTGGNEPLKFEEGVDSYVPYVGKLKDNLNVTLGEMIATMCSYGSISIQELQQRVKTTLVSSTSIVEGDAHDVILKEQN